MMRGVWLRRLYPGRASDLDFTRDLRNISREYFFNNEEVTETAHQQFITEVSNTPWKYFFIIMLDTESIGTVSLDIGEDGLAIIGNVLIHPTFRGKGRGSRAIRLVITMAKILGATIVTLKVKADNTKAINFYNRIGFNKEVEMIYEFIED